MSYTAENLERTNRWLFLAENQNSTKIYSPRSGPSGNDTSTKQLDSFSNGKKPFICSLCGVKQEIFKIHSCNRIPTTVFKCTDCKTVFTNKNDFECHVCNHFNMKTGKLCDLLRNSKVKHKETQSDLTLSRPLHDGNISEEFCISTLKTESDVRFGPFTSASCEYAFLEQDANSLSHIDGNKDGVSRQILVNGDNLRAHQCENSRLESHYFDTKQLSMGFDGRSNTESETFCNAKMTEDVPLNHTYALYNSRALLGQAANSSSRVDANKDGVVRETLVNGDNLFEHHYVNSSGDSHGFDTEQLLMDHGGRSEAESETFLDVKMTKDTTLQAVPLDHNYALYHGTSEVHKHQGYDAVFKMASIWQHHDCVDDKPYECEDCGVSFLTVLNLQSHDCPKHNSNKSYACNDCELTFEDKEQLRSHCYIHQDKDCVTKRMMNANFLPEQSVGNVNPLPASINITDNRKISNGHSVVSTNIKSSELSTATSGRTLLVENISVIDESLQLPSSSPGNEEQLQALIIVSKETVCQPSVITYPFLLQLLLTEPLPSPTANPFNANSTTSTNATQLLAVPLSTSISNEVEMSVPHTTNTFEGQNLAKSIVTFNCAEPFRCNLCESSLSTALEYQEHCCPQNNAIGIKNGEENFGNTVEFPTLLDSQTNCTDETPYLCPECEVTFTKKAPFLNHSCIQLGGKPHACHRCKVSFAEDKLLQTHYCIYDDGDTSETTRNRNTRSSYWDTDCMPLTDGMESLRWLCDNNSKFNDTMHMSADGERTVNAVNSKTQVQTSDQALKCVDCNETFTNLETYRNHCQGHANDRRHKCSCGASFRTQLGYERHSARHSGMPHTDPPYTCQECGKSFKKHRNLLEHHAVHSGEKPHKCDTCYAIKKRLKNHLVSHSRRYVCDECGNAYSSATYLRIHSNIHTGVRPFTCSYCLKTFKTSSHLNHHVRSHTGDRPYKCQACNATFADATTYRNHLSVHTAKSVLCETCGTAFSTKRLLKRYQITR